MIKDFIWMPTDKDLHQIKIMSDKETINYILEKKCSIARYGDGEIGYLLSKHFKHFFQPPNIKLQEKLRFVLKNPIDSCVLALPYWMNRRFDKGWYKDFQKKYFYKFCSFINKKYTYASANCFGSTFFAQGGIDSIKKLWDKKDVILVTGENSAFIWDERLFDNIKSVEYIYTKSVDAFSEYDNIIDSIEKINSNKDKLVLMSLGLTATVLAYDLSKKGYQAIDIGHVSNYFLNAIGELPNIGELRRQEKFIDGVTDIKDLKVQYKIGSNNE